MLDDIVREQLRSELLQIEDLFAEFAELLDKSASTEPSMVERTLPEGAVVIDELEVTVLPR